MIAPILARRDSAGSCLAVVLTDFAEMAFKGQLRAGMLGEPAMLAATTQGPISTVVLMMEFTGYARSAVVPLLLIVATATLIARTIEQRSIYDARLTDAQVRERQPAGERGPPEAP